MTKKELLVFVYISKNEIYLDYNITNSALSYQYILNKILHRMIFINRFKRSLCLHKHFVHVTKHLLHVQNKTEQLNQKKKKKND